MQNVIELTRQLRERHTLMLKIPLKELTIFHPDQEYIDDVQPLTSYLESELNMREIIFSTDETKTAVKYRATADWAVLGKKLRKDLVKVKNGLPNLASEDVKRYVDSGRITVAGVELVAGDLQVARYVDLPSDSTLATNTDNDVVVILDTKIYPELEEEGLARELINRVQQLRKKAGVKATDDVEVFYKLEDEVAGARVVKVIKEHADLIRRTTRSLPVEDSLRKPDAVVILTEEQELGGTKFTLSAVKIS